MVRVTLLIVMVQVSCHVLDPAAKQTLRCPTVQYQMLLEMGSLRLNGLQTIWKT